MRRLARFVLTFTYDAQPLGRHRRYLNEPGVRIVMVELASPGLLRRERIHARIAAATQRRIAFIIAPAGSGKTVALQHYLDRLDGPYVRFDMRPEHATLLGLVRGFSEALAKVAPHAREAAVDVVRTTLASGDAPKSAVSWMAEQLRDFAGTICLDDVHIADADPLCAQFLAQLMEQRAQRHTWIVAGRAITNLPLSSWVVYGTAEIPIGEDDLRFTEDETAEAARMLGSRLDADEISHLRTITSGWATALTLALRASQHADLDRAGLKARELSYDYLAEHVYRTLSEPERDLLLVAALLPSIETDILVHAGFSEAPTLLSGLSARMTFLSIHPEEFGAASPRRYRCHDLFRDFLEHQLELRGPLVLSNTLQQAAEGLAAASKPAAALRLFTRARAHHRMIRLLERCGFDLLREGHADLVDSALDEIATTPAAKHAVVLGLRGIRASEEAEYGTAEALLLQAIRQCDDHVFRARLTLRLGFAMLNAGRSPVALLESAVEDPAVPFSARAELLAQLASAYAGIEAFDRVRPLLDEVAAMAANVESESTRATILHCLGLAALLCGDSKRTKHILLPAAELAVRNRLHKLACNIYGNLSSNAFLNDEDCPQALAFARRNAEIARRSPEHQYQFQATAEELRIRAQMGDAARVRELLEQCAPFGDSQSRFIGAILWDARAMLAGGEGRFADAAHAQSEASAIHQFGSEQARSQALHALFCAAQGDRRRALEILGAKAPVDACSYDEAVPRSRILVLSRFLRGLAYGISQRLTTAKRLISIDAAGQHPTLQVFYAAVTSIAAFAQHGSVSEDLPQHFATLRVRGYGGFASLFEQLIERLRSERRCDALTPAEHVILCALAQGDRPKEIAEKTKSSIHTVRWHIRGIINKFSCSGVDQALRIARTRGLL